MGAPLQCYTCISGDEFSKSRGVGDREWYCGVMVESTFEELWQERDTIYCIAY